MVDSERGSVPRGCHNSVWVSCLTSSIAVTFRVHSWKGFCETGFLRRLPIRTFDQAEHSRLAARATRRRPRSSPTSLRRFPLASPGTVESSRSEGAGAPTRPRSLHCLARPQRACRVDASPQPLARESPRSTTSTAPPACLRPPTISSLQLCPRTCEYAVAENRPGTADV
jgi:hypothetical protein